MRALRPGILTFILIISFACSDDTDQDAGITTGDGKVGDMGADAFKKSLPPNYKPYKCSTPGRSCNAHDPCAFNAICGADNKCWPEYLMDCNDGLDCTVDKCAGLGLCENTPKKGFCRVMYKTGVDDGGVPITQPKCVKVGTKKPDDPCWGCNPTDSDGGVSNNTKWMPVSGGTCDDGNKCTRNDTCLNGTCKGQSFAGLCSDGIGCTLDLCDGNGGCLGHVLKSDFCLINGICYQKGGKKPDGTCNECDPAKSQSDFTPIANTCTILSKCYKNGDFNNGKCAICDVKTSSTKWTVKGDYCLINNVCKKPGDKDSIACSTCDPKTDKYGWTQIAGLCKIDGKCYSKGAMHPLGCAECNPAVSTTKWTVKGDYCLINNKCYNPKTKDSIGCAECDTAKSKYAWTPIAGLCKISGTCYKSGDTHPGKCATCDPKKSTTAWTVKPSLNECLINNVCKKAGAKDLAGCATCDPTKSKVAWTGTAGLCNIDGVCYQKAAQHPKGCATCDPAKSATAWTPNSGCVIAGQCLTSGAKDGSGCGVCTPSSSATQWTVSAGKCVVGPSKCVSKGASEPGGCGSCDPAKDANGWTPGKDCKAVHAWSKKFGGSSSDLPYAMAADASGNIYVTGYFYNTINFGGSSHSSKGSADIYVASFTPSGQYRWSTAFGGSSSDYGYGLAVDAAGNVYVTGSMYNSMNCGGSTLSTKGGRDVFVCAFDSAGKHKWSSNFGSTSTDYGYAIGTDSNSNVYVTGYHYGSIDFGGSTLKSSGSYDIFLASFDSNGKHRWSKNFGNTSSDYGYGLAVDGSDNVYITGTFYLYGINFGGGILYGNGSNDIFLASFSPSGNHRWSKAFGGTSSDYAYGAAVDKSGNVYITGYMYGSVNFGGGSLTSNGSGDAYVASFTPAGAHRWSKNFGGTSSDYGYGLAADAKGNMYVTGYYYNTITFGKGTVGSHTSNGSYDAFIASFDATGNYRWSRSHGSTSSDYGRAVAAAPDGGAYAAGYFYYTVDFGGGSLTASSTDIYLMKLKQ